MTVSLSIHLSILALAIMIKDIAIVFEFAGTIGCSFISYFFPAIGYLLALKMYGTDRIRAKWSTTMFKAFSWLFIVIGSAAVCSYFVTIGLKLSGRMTTASVSH